MQIRKVIKSGGKVKAAIRTVSAVLVTTGVSKVVRPVTKSIAKSVGVRYGLGLRLMDLAVGALVAEFVDDKLTYYIASGAQSFFNKIEDEVSEEDRMDQLNGLIDEAKSLLKDMKNEKEIDPELNDLAMENLGKD